MTRPELLRQLDEIFQIFEQNGSFGNVQIDFVAGRADLIRQQTTRKINNGGGNTHEWRNNSR